MNLSRHAIVRADQRGIPQSIVDMVVENGTLEQAPGGVYRLKMTRKDCQELKEHLKKTLQLVDKARDCVLVVDGMSVLTTYRRS